MKSTLLRVCLAGFVFLTFSLQASDWPWWRGPDRNGIADSDQDPPLKFSDTKNVVWSAPIPGRGHGSATVVGERTFIAAAEPETQTQSVLCLDRETGEQIWKADVHRGGWPEKMNKKASQASSTPACDGERVYINFLNDGAVYTTALSLEGEQIWQAKITDYVLHQGFGSSPAIYKGLVIVSADNKGGGAICGLDQKSGEVVWKVERAKKPNYASPIILEAAGGEHLFLTGTDLVTSLDPLTGKTLWETEGATTECVTSTVTDGERILTSGGYPKNHVSAVDASSGKLIWETKERVYVPSMLIQNGYVYAVMDAGVAICWESATGKEMWKGRLGGTFSSSPVLVSDRIYAFNESGDAFVFKADPAEFQILAENKLGDEIYSTPTICGSQIFIRVAEYDGENRQEKLYCLGE